MTRTPQEIFWAKDEVLGHPGAQMYAGYQVAVNGLNYPWQGRIRVCAHPSPSAMYYKILAKER